MRKEKFVEKSILKHGNKYDYSNVPEEVCCKEKVEIICKSHGSFFQCSEIHYRGSGCPKCASANSNKDRKLTTEEFIKRAVKVHGAKYDYSKVDYKNSKTKVEIVCRTHGSFFQCAESHYRGIGCSKCAKNAEVTFKEFVRRSNEKHNFAYTYNESSFTNVKTKTKIVCSKHGEFWQVPFDHYSGNGCPKCANVVKITTEEFIEKAIKVHGDEYDYSKVDYVNAHVKVKIICPKHGIFEQKPDNHINGKQGCSKCNRSKGELRIAKFLNSIETDYKSEFRFNDCRYKKPLPFDFAVFKNGKITALIEFDGIQHFRKVLRYKNTDGDLNLRKEKDLIKTKYCEKNNIKLIRISCFEFDNIETILKNNLN
jgi:hypothetical protein